ncbi:protein turtle-like [Amphibalanus amphitrite]|uniref:protein turtle-like n=1 Tax=Amphibalanus amphitrite TaxID=1232801 RepID=UPI001C90C298|nr:protein turtle-like [Amphibalanus amphitrite]
MLLMCAALLVLTPSVGLEVPTGRHVTALVGSNVILECPLNFPNDEHVPYVIEWKKQHLRSPLYIWYDGYPPHVADSYRGRVSRVSVRSREHGLASLNVTNVTEPDGGWYECIVHFLNQSPAVLGNATWVHLDVHAAPRLVRTPARDVFVNIGDSLTLTCQARGTPQPVISWLKEGKPVRKSDTISLERAGSELRMTKIAAEDIGDYACVAANAVGDVQWKSKIIMAGGAEIEKGPSNDTKLAGEQAVLQCRTRARPDNVTVHWLRDGVDVTRLAELRGRLKLADNGSLVLAALQPDDHGRYTCQASNGIGTAQRASAYLTVHFPADVPYTPAVQHLTAGSPGVIRCHIRSSPPFQFVTWYHNRRSLEPKHTPGVSVLKNGSLLIEKVTTDHRGTYRCQPYNLHGTGGDSGEMRVEVRERPRFLVRPRNLYQRRLQDTVQMPCVVEGTPAPEVTWRRHDNQSLPSDRISLSQGNITIRLLQKSDFGYYECVARNSAATIVTSTQLVTEGATSQAPHNISTNVSSSAITVRWLPGYSGERLFDQRHSVWYREEGASNWNTYEIKAGDDVTDQVTIYHLPSGTVYELMVAAKNELGDSLFSEQVSVRTLTTDEMAGVDAGADTAASRKEALDGDGPLPGAPVDLNVTESHGGGFLVSWKPPVESTHVPVLHYEVHMKVADGKWTNQGDRKITKTKYIVRQLHGGRKYYFKVLAFSAAGSTASEELMYEVPEHVQQKAITAALVGGLLLLIVSIILSICTVKICNKRKRRQQEKEYNMVACRVTESHSVVNSPAPVPRALERRGTISLDHY